MARVVKKPDVRRLEIIAAAAKLFEERGYENTPVEAIILSAGIAKGTFYYYFKSKKDILQAIVDQLGVKMAAHFLQIAEMEQLTVLQKLKLMIRGDD